MYILWYALLAFLGGVVSAWIGWLDSKEAFDIRKFGASVLRALVAGGLAAIAGAVTPPATTTALIIMLISAFLAGAGVDVLGNRIQGARSDSLSPES